MYFTSVMTTIEYYDNYHKHVLNTIYINSLLLIHSQVGSCTAVVTKLDRKSMATVTKVTTVTTLPYLYPPYTALPCSILRSCCTAAPYRGIEL